MSVARDNRDTVAKRRCNHHGNSVPFDKLKDLVIIQKLKPIKEIKIILLSSESDTLTAFLWIPIVPDEDFLVRRPEERRPVDGVVEAQAAVVENVHIPGADLIQRLELEGRDPTLLQDEQRDSANAEREDEIITREKAEVGQEEEVRKWAGINETKGRKT